MLRRVKRSALTALAVAPLAAASLGATPVEAKRWYSGHISLIGGGGPVRSGSQGAGWQAVFKERRRGRVRYRVCLTHRTNKTSRCWSRATRRDGTSVVFVALFVNDRGGPGPWKATWLVRGRRVASYRFTVRPEGV